MKVPERKYIMSFFQLHNLNNRMRLRRKLWWFVILENVRVQSQDKNELHKLFLERPFFYRKQGSWFMIFQLFDCLYNMLFWFACFMDETRFSRQWIGCFHQSIKLKSLKAEDKFQKKIIHDFWKRPTSVISLRSL